VNLARDHECLVVSDECYEWLRFDGSKHTCAAEFSKENVIVVNSFSKAFVMTGLRLGYVLAPKQVLKPILQVHQYNTSCAATPIQVAASEALNNPEKLREAITSNLKVLDDRRRTAIDGFGRIQGIEMSYDPVGAFYVFPSVRNTGMSGAEFVKSALDRVAVIVVPGTEFGDAFPDNVRISYGSATSERIREAAKRIAHFLDSSVSSD
jgi:aspartate/methionine/tyrosine aminotransferase